jgi:hypothetical protein
MIKSNTLVADYDCISKDDEAVDRSGDDFEHKWKVARDGLGDYPLLPEAKPTIFRLRHLGPVERAYLESAGGFHEQLVAAAALALVGVSDLNDSNGEAVEFRREATKFGTQKVLHAHASVLAAIPLRVLGEIGNVVLEKMTLRPS